MRDFSPIFRREQTLTQMAEGLTRDDLRAETNELIDAMLAAVAECEDADVTFVPRDATAEGELGWTLGHVVVHTTAGSEESAFIAAELARGVPEHGRSRYETPWETVTTIGQVRQRLEESRRMRLALLDVWPDEPHLDVRQDLPWLGDAVNAPARFVLGLAHDGVHLGQIRDIVEQARAARHGG
jgi:hypothetical protein